MLAGVMSTSAFFFAFSTFVMKALSQLPAEQGVAAMQRINEVVMNPVFLGLFVGTAVLAGLCIFAAFFPWGTTRSSLLLTGGSEVRRPSV